MILRLDKGYDTEIGEAGIRLSGGQRQRIALARAVFGRPRLVILDEPNASLDGEGEEALNRAIAALKACGSTVIVIGHRPSLLQEVTKVVLLVAGQVEMFGPRADVMERLTRRNVQPVPVNAPARQQAAASVRFRHSPGRNPRAGIRVDHERPFLITASRNPSGSQSLSASRSGPP